MENVRRSMQQTEVLDSRGKPTGEWKYDGAVANQALGLLGKELGMFVDRSVSWKFDFDLSTLSPDQLDRYMSSLQTRIAEMEPAGIEGPMVDVSAEAVTDGEATDAP